MSRILFIDIPPVYVFPLFWVSVPRLYARHLSSISIPGTHFRTLGVVHVTALDILYTTTLDVVHVTTVNMRTGKINPMTEYITKFITYIISGARLLSSKDVSNIPRYSGSRLKEGEKSLHTPGGLRKHVSQKDSATLRRICNVHSPLANLG